MKKKILNALLLLSAIASFMTSCKKNNDGKDTGTAIANTLWTGNINYTGLSAQPISMSFDNGGQATFYELSGESTGTWTVTGNTIKVNFGGNGFAADIANGNTLTNIKTTAGSKWMLINAALNNSTDASLDNTNWTGTNIAISFKPNNKLDLVLGVGLTLYQNLPYIRKGKSIRFQASAAYKWFLVTASDASYKGANSFSPDPTVYLFDLSKK